MSELIEIAARAIRKAFADDSENQEMFGDMDGDSPDPPDELELAMARAVIAAIADNVTEKMVEAGVGALSTGRRDWAEAAVAQVIRAALRAELEDGK